MDDWPFDQPPNCASITLRRIIFDGGPILQVFHDADDHGWQFLDLSEFDEDDASVVALSEIVRRDQSVCDVANLPPGWYAWRQTPESPWQRAEHK